MSSSATHASADDLAGRDVFPAVCSALIALPFLFPIAAGPSVNVWQQLTSWLCVAALFLVAGARRYKPDRSLVVWLAASAVLIACLRIPHLGTAPWLSAVAVIFAAGMAAFVGAGLAQDRARQQAALALGLLWAGLVSAVLGLLQYYDLAGILVPWTTEPGSGQAFGNLRQRNQFASLISMALIAALWLFGRYRNGPPLRRLQWMSMVLLLLVAAAASTSRTGLLEIFGIAGVGAFIAQRERRARAEAAAALRLPAPLILLSWIPLYFAIAWLLPQLAGAGVDSMVQRLSDGAPVGHSRLVLWSNVLTLIAERPWAGWGWAELSFAHYMHGPLYPGARFVEILDNAHNLPLHLAVELGIPAAVLICGGFLWLVIAARPWRECEPFKVMAWGLLGVIVLHSLLEYPLWYGPFQLVFGLCLGVVCPDSRLRRAFSARGRQTLVLWRWTPALLAAVVFYAAWDYIRVSQIYLPRQERLAAYEDDTLSKLQGSRLFANQVQFAELTLATVTPANAGRVHELASRLVHFSPEPRVVIKLIESAELLGHAQEATAEVQRFRLAFPADYAEWLHEGIALKETKGKP